MWRPKDGKTVHTMCPDCGSECATIYEAGWDACITHLKSQEHADWSATEEGQSSKGEWYFIPEE